MDKKERFQEFIKRLEETKPVSSSEEAFEMLANTLNSVENELSNIPYFPSQWMNIGSMYPPNPDNKRITENPEVNRYRSRQHNTYIGHQCSLINRVFGTSLATSERIKLCSDFPVIIAFCEQPEWYMSLYGLFSPEKTMG